MYAANLLSVSNSTTNSVLLVCSVYSVCDCIDKDKTSLFNFILSSVFTHTQTQYMSQFLGRDTIRKWFKNKHTQINYILKNNLNINNKNISPYMYIKNKHRNLLTSIK